jgi:putative transposase
VLNIDIIRKMENNRIIKEKRHRLDRKEYIGQKRISFTLCIKERKKLFCNKSIVDKFVEILRIVLLKHKIKNWIYVFMPDHLHLVVEGLNENSDIYRALVEFKQKTGIIMKKYKWQKDFYDHIHREEENIFNSLWYVINNPIGKELAKEPLEYFGIGSLDFNINEIIKKIYNNINV